MGKKRANQDDRLPKSKRQKCDNKEKPFNCGSCKQGYKTEKGLKNHVVKVHEDVNFDKGTFVCEICDHNFDTLILMNDHIASFHEGKGGVILEDILNLVLFSIISSQCPSTYIRLKSYNILVMVPKLYIPRTINIWKKTLTKAI